MATIGFKAATIRSRIIFPSTDYNLTSAKTASALTYDGVKRVNRLQYTHENLRKRFPDLQGIRYTFSFFELIWADHYGEPLEKCRPIIKSSGRDLTPEQAEELSKALMVAVHEAKGMVEHPDTTLETLKDLAENIPDQSLEK